MSLLLIVGQYFIWSLFTILSGFLGGVGLAGGFAAFKSIRDKFAEKKDEVNHEKNRNYLDSLEQQVAGAAVTE
jgi:hypothetical protein